MIVRDKPGAWQLLFAVRGSVLPRIAPQLLFIVACATAVVAVDKLLLPLTHSDATPFAVIGVALSLFLGFRNNAAYDRWWEARKLWGGLLADIRSFAREAEVFIADKPMRQALLRQLLAFIHLHRANLRRLPTDALAHAHAEAAAPAAGLTNAPHPPCASLNLLNTTLADAHRAGRIDSVGALAISERLAALTLQQAGCERIANTPLPYVYSLLVFRTIYIYCLLLPLALIDQSGWMTPLFVGIVAYTFFGLAEVTEELAHPFGQTVNALPLDAICRAAEISLASHLDQPAPPALLPAGFTLN